MLPPSHMLLQACHTGVYANDWRYGPSRRVLMAQRAILLRAMPCPSNDFMRQAVAQQGSACTARFCCMVEADVVLDTQASRALNRI